MVGALPRDAALALPERHLGLVQAGEHADLAARLDRLADTGERHLDLDALIGGAGPLEFGAAPSAAAALPPPGQRIALACDARLHASSIRTCSMAGAGPAPRSCRSRRSPTSRRRTSCDCCWLPGGYPELHAGALAGAHSFPPGCAQFAETRPVHGECGGYMVLGEGLEDADGVRHAMTGLLGHATSFAKRRLHLGYREARLRDRQPARAGGQRSCAATSSTTPRSSPAGTDEPFVEVADSDGRRRGKAGGRRGHVTGAFFHAIAAAQR